MGSDFPLSVNKDLKTWTKILVLFVLTFLQSLAIGVVSGGSEGGCENRTSPDYNVESHTKNAHSAGLALLGYLEANVEKLAIVARAGGDISVENFQNPDKQKYTHAGFVYKSTEQSPYLFKHVLNICSGESSGIFVQNLVQFFNDGPYFYDFRILVPSPYLQEQIVAVLESDLASTLHNPQYSNIANPFHNDYQNSNGWILSVVASAQAQAHYAQALSSIEQAQNWYRTHFIPSQVKVGALRGLFSVFVPNATVSDHTEEEKASGWYNFVSTAALFRYLKDTDDVVEIRELCHSQGCNIPFALLNKQKKQYKNSFEEVGGR